MATHGNGVLMDVWNRLQKVFEPLLIDHSGDLSNKHAVTYCNGGFTYRDFIILPNKKFHLSSIFEAVVPVQEILWGDDHLRLSEEFAIYHYILYDDTNYIEFNALTYRGLWQQIYDREFCVCIPDAYMSAPTSKLEMEYFEIVGHNFSKTDITLLELSI